MSCSFSMRSFLAFLICALIAWLLWKRPALATPLLSLAAAYVLLRATIWWLRLLSVLILVGAVLWLVWMAGQHLST